MRKVFLAALLIASSASPLAAAENNGVAQFNAKVGTHKIMVRSEAGKADADIVLQEGRHDHNHLTPSTVVAIKTVDDNYMLVSKGHETRNLRVYKQEEAADLAETKSQIMALQDNRAFGVVVDTSRKSKRERTYINYLKESTRFTGIDFEIYVNNPGGTDYQQTRTFYQGGHLVDDKYRAEGSNTDFDNFVPQASFYNSPLKEYLVNTARGYVEIPIYSENPPEIEVKRKWLNVVNGEEVKTTVFHKIPVAILLVLFNDNGIGSMYCFPNNQFNYFILDGAAAGGKEGKAKAMTPLFKLRDSFAPLLYPAIIQHLDGSNAAYRNQVSYERIRQGLTEDFIDGLTIADSNMSDELMAQLASAAFHGADVELTHLLATDARSIARMNENPTNADSLQQAFNHLAKFAAEYAMNNTLKSEVATSESRLMMLHYITGLLEATTAAEDGVLFTLNERLGQNYQSLLADLDRDQQHLGFEELLYFAKIRQRLASPFFLKAIAEPIELNHGMRYEQNTALFFQVLETLWARAAREKELSVDQRYLLIDLFVEAHHIVDYWQVAMAETDQMTKAHTFFKRTRADVLAWNDGLKHDEGEFKSAPNASIVFSRDLSSFDIGAILNSH